MEDILSDYHIGGCECEKFGLPLNFPPGTESSDSFIIEIGFKNFNRKFLNPYKENLGNISFEMIPIKGGEFIMGDNEDESDDAPEHNAFVSDFLLGKHEVTIEEYLLFAHETRTHLPKWYEDIVSSDSLNNSISKSRYVEWGLSLLNPRLPIIGVSWIDANSYCHWLSNRTKKKFRLPTEAEWEYAAGGGSNNRSKFAGASNEEQLDLYAWHDGNSNNIIHEVGLKQPNALGLYDMCGNVWEWCLDYYRSDSYIKGRKKKASETQPDKFRVYRGGSCLNTTKYTSVTYRNFCVPDSSEENLGFRVVLEV